MAFSFLQTGERRALKLHGAVTIYDARELTAQLREMASANAPIEVDTAELDRIDTCMLQLLYALRSSVANVSFPDPSPTMISATEKIGLHRELLSTPEEL